MRIGVVGGTGVVGSYMVEAARTAGHQVVVISRFGCAGRWPAGWSCPSKWSCQYRAPAAPAGPCGLEP